MQRELFLEYKIYIVEFGSLQHIAVMQTDRSKQVLAWQTFTFEQISSRNLAWVVFQSNGIVYEEFFQIGPL